MRVLFSSTWGYGHVFPMVPLAQACVAAGHDVLWMTNEPACGLVEAAGIRCRSGGLDTAGVRAAQQRNAANVRPLPPPERAAFAFPSMFGEWATPAMVADLLPLTRSWRPDLLVHESAELAAPLAGAVVGVPSVTHSFGGAVPASFLTDAGERLAPLWAQHGVDVPPHAGCFGSAYLDICPPSVQPVDRSHIRDVQPLRPMSWTGPPPATSPSYLHADDRPLIYLTLGTVQNHAPVLRPALEALAALPVRVLATVGPDGDPEILGPQPANVTIERWVPQSLVLHSCDVVVSHAGSGTFLGALAAGLPQLCLPQAADQFRNADAGTRAGAALALPPEGATGDAVATAVLALLREPVYRAAAASVAGEISAMPAPAAVVELLAASVENG